MELIELLVLLRVYVGASYNVIYLEWPFGAASVLFRMCFPFPLLLLAVV